MGGLGGLGTGRVLTGVGLAVIVAAVMAVLVANTRAPSTHAVTPDALRVPQTLAGSPLVASVRGPAALREIARLHGKRIDAVDAVVARYDNAITLWVSQSPTALAASSLLWRMNRRMAGGTEAFSAPQPQEVHSRTIFSTTGLGQQHIYYQSGRSVLWVAAPAQLAEGIAEELLAIYP